MAPRREGGMRRLLPLLVLALLPVACQVTGTEEIRIEPSREYRPERMHRRRKPVILIPGTLGSRLYNVRNGEIAWGNFAATVSDLTDGLDLPIERPILSQNSDDLRAYRVLDRAEILAREGSGEVRFYAELIDHLSQTLGYRPAFGERVHAGNDLFVFFYDWRRSNVEAAGQLAEFIQGIRRDLDDPNLKFTFLCVSNGGLIARYYLRHGGRDVVSGASPLPEPAMEGLRDCDRLVCLGTPQLGTLDALHLLHDGYAPNFLGRRHPPATIFSFPAAFELLPEPGEPVFVGSGGEDAGLDLWDPAVWKRLGLSVFSESEQDRLRQQVILNLNKGDDRDVEFARRQNIREQYLVRVLDHARRFRAAIKGPPEVATSVILGVTTPTLARVGLVWEGTEAELLFRPRVPWGRYDPMTEGMFALGDGVVTRRSGLGLPAASAGAPDDAFRRALHDVVFTPFTHRAMFEDELLRLALAESLSGP
ncbi:MAG: hypothetical protein IT463_04505 [Planctomycetes bacterium]|nr:hypothetical protein [Planctomycetota bacterium]